MPGLWNNATGIDSTLTPHEGIATMLAGWWLVFAGLPVFTQPLPEAPDVPAAVAVASGQVSLRQHCYRLDCGDGEWIGAPQRLDVLLPPGTSTQLNPIRPSGLSNRRYIALRSPATRRDWYSTTGNANRVGASYAFEPVRSADARLQMEFGTGYRLTPYADLGTRTMGPIARGRVLYTQQLGEHARLSQQLHVETGRANTFARQIIGLDLKLIPDWTLHSELMLRHDTAADGGDGRTERESSLRLRYAF